MTYRILDLFCGAGGAAKGYTDAGFEVVGVDISRQPHYPYEFIQRDALTFVELLFDPFSADRPPEWDLKAPYLLQDFDAIHASPPCQAYSDTAVLHRERDYPKLIEPTRKLLRETGLPYVIENVESAPLIDPVTLCATNFDGTLVEVFGQLYQLQRHRGFETNWPLLGHGACVHLFKTFPVYGHGTPGNMPWFTGAPMARLARQVMKTPWMTRDEFTEAIPPYYTKFVGKQLRWRLNATSKP